MKKKTAFERIHNLNPAFNRIFSLPLYVSSFLVILIFFFSPYHLRIFFAFLINLFFNRIAIYSAYLSRFIARPLARVVLTLVYFVPIGAYSLLFRFFGGRGSPSERVTDRETVYFQS